LLLPLKGAPLVQEAMRELLAGVAGTVVARAVGEDATLYELAALVSEPGAPRQPVHPDNPYQDAAPLLTCFVALQDISIDMGPTTFLPRTHTKEAHASFDASTAARDALLCETPARVALLRAGDCALFDSRTLHCGGANTDATRAVFYFSFRNARATAPVGNVGSMRADVAPLPLAALRSKLAEATDANDPFDESREAREAARAYRAAADADSAEAKFNLAMCYARGEGVDQDIVEAARLFRDAAEAGLALAQCQLGVYYSAGNGVAKDDAEAVRWFERAAAQGLPQAEHNLGFCLAESVGVAVNLPRAVELLASAAAQGHPGSEQLRGKVVQRIAGVGS
jgi:TPR repeat protein